MKVKRRIAIAMTLAVCMALALDVLSGCSGASSVDPEEFDYDTSIEPTTMLDNDIVVIAANDLNFEDDKVILDLSITNKTNTPIVVSSNSYGFAWNFVNGYMIKDGGFDVDIEPGQTVQEQSDFNVSELQMFGIHAVGEIGLGVYVKDSDYETIYRGLSSVRTSSAESDMTQPTTFDAAINNPKMQELLDTEVQNSTSKLDEFDTDQIKFNSSVIATNKDGQKMVMFEIENVSDEPIKLAYYDVTANGQIVHSSFADYSFIMPGKKSVEYFNLSNMIDYECPEMSSDDITEVGFQYEVFDDEVLDKNQGAMSEYANTTEVKFGF